MTDFDYGLLKEMADEAPEAGYRNYNYGRVNVTAKIVSWSTDSSGNRVATRRDPNPKGNKLSNGEYPEYAFAVNVKELNPDLQFDEWTRRVNVQKSGPNKKTEWTEIVEKSLIAVFGKNWDKELAKHPYVEVEEDTSMATPNKNTGKVYGVPKFTRVFKSKAECEKARAARFSPDGTDPSVIPQAIVNQAKAVIDGENPEEALALLQENFSEYNAQELYNLATA